MVQTGKMKALRTEAVEDLNRNLYYSTTSTTAWGIRKEKSLRRVSYYDQINNRTH